MDNSLEESATWNRLSRLMLSSRDFQQALSAAAFLYEEMDEARSLPDWRRLRCYETNMVVAYARPFSQAHGAVKRLSLNELDVAMDKEERALHDHLIERRNRLYAHSDAEFVPMSVEVWATAMPGGPDFEFVMPKFDERCGFTSAEVFQVQILCRKVLHTTVLAAQELKDRFSDRLVKTRLDMT